ncbi:zinc finger and SCAN domain-containing protein 4-like [Artibeus jamaicensis]|uniref:zinc finger and SCAN domain-containing protein 4-like n=1 Tax=Artibeus jamaicensis TaxID=9417 RepID=UPI00235B057B|nr:zinc finger and SCAN domain-containing protein 4-like [Artibeus jamaicensis]
MALYPRNPYQAEPSRNDHESENLEIKPSREPAIQEGEGISRFPSTSTELSSSQNNSNLGARQELLRLYKSICSWLQPEKRSKDEIISSLVLEQFMISRHCSDRSTLKEKWEASGRNLETFAESLSDDCMRPPGLVHVHMQGQEALFSDTVPLREVIVHFKKQLSAGTPTVANVGTPSWTAQDASLQRGQGDEDEEHGGNISLKANEENDNIASQGHQIPPLLIIQGENYPGPEGGDVSLENPHSSRRVSLGTSRSQEGFLKGRCNQDVLMEVGPAFLSRLHQVTPEPYPTHRSSAGSSTWGGHKERFHRTQRLYQCKKCRKVFRYFSWLKVHQRRHSEKIFICAVCDKRFVQALDLHMHHNIHVGEKPFRCGTCAKPFSYRTNLLAHERIHTGEKPYVCSVCQRCFRQSSTYHRHLRAHQRSALRRVSSTPEASSM